MLLASLTNALMKIRLPRWFHDRSHRCFLDKPHFTCQFIKYEFFVKSSTYFLTKPKCLTTDIADKLHELDSLADDMASCLKTRIVAWHVFSLFPCETQLKLSRRKK